MVAVDGLVSRVDDLDDSAGRHDVQRSAVWRHCEIGRVVSDGDRGDDGIRGGIDHRDRVRLRVRHVRATAVAADGDACGSGADRNRAHDGAVAVSITETTLAAW